MSKVFLLKLDGDTVKESIVLTPTEFDNAEVVADREKILSDVNNVKVTEEVHNVVARMLMSSSRKQKVIKNQNGSYQLVNK